MTVIGYCSIWPKICRMRRKTYSAMFSFNSTALASLPDTKMSSSSWLSPTSSRAAAGSTPSLNASLLILMQHGFSYFADFSFCIMIVAEILDFTSWKSAFLLSAFAFASMIDIRCSDDIDLYHSDFSPPGTASTPQIQKQEFLIKSCNYLERGEVKVALGWWDSSRIRR